MSSSLHLPIPGRNRKGSRANKKVASLSSLRKLSKEKLASSLHNLIFQNIPLRTELIAKLCTHLRLHGMVEGIFRIPGTATDTRLFWCSFAEEEYDQIDMFGVKPHVVASALVMYLCEQKCPLIPVSLHEKLMALPNSTNVEQDLDDFAKEIPPENRKIFRFLLELFENILQKSEVTKMTAQNLGICMAPVLAPQEVLDPLGVQKIIAGLTFLFSHTNIILDGFPEISHLYRILDVPPAMTEDQWKLLLGDANERFLEQGEEVLVEGASNNSLYRLVDGKLEVMRNSSILRTLQPGDVFGEMSFLGTHETSATVAAAKKSIVQVAECGIIQAIFLAQPELSKIFYWNMALKLARRLSELHASAKTWRARTSTTTNSSLSLSIGVDTNSSVTVILDSAMTVEQLCAKVAERANITSDNYKLFLIRTDTSTSERVNSIIPATSLLRPIRMGVAKLVFCVDEPNTLKKKSEFSLKSALHVCEFACKLQKANGKMYISHSSIAHFSKLLGLEKKKIFELRHVKDIKQNEVTLEITLNKQKETVHKFIFKDAITTSKAYSLLTSLRSKDDGDKSPRIAEEEDFVRALVIKSYKPEDPTHLTLRANEVLLVTDKLQGKFWLGQSNGVTGLFPVDHVEIIYEPASNKALLKSGYVDTGGQPTRDDWRLILYGGQVKQFKKDTVILQEGDLAQCLYQISNGSCRVEKGERVLCTLNMDETFGEVSFLIGGGATATVIADDDQCEVYMIDAMYLKRLFNSRPELAGKFFKYLSTVLERRLRGREGELLGAV